MTQAQSLQFIEMFPNLSPGLVYDVVSASKDDNEILEKLMTLNDMPAQNRPQPQQQPPQAQRNPTPAGYPSSGSSSGVPAYAQPPTTAPPGYTPASTPQQSSGNLPPGYPGSNNARTTQQNQPPRQTNPPAATPSGYGQPAYGAQAQQRPPAQQPAVTPAYTAPTPAPAPKPATNTFTTSSTAAPAYRQNTLTQPQQQPHQAPVVDVSPSAVRARQQVNDMLNRPNPTTGINTQPKPTGYEAAMGSTAPSQPQPTATVVNRERDYEALAANMAAREAAEAIRLAKQPVVEDVEPPASTPPKLPPGLAPSGVQGKKPANAASGKTKPQPTPKANSPSSDDDDDDDRHPAGDRNSADKGGGWFNPFGLFGGGGKKEKKKDAHKKEQKKDTQEQRKPEPRKDDPKKPDPKPMPAADGRKEPQAAPTPQEAARPANTGTRFPTMSPEPEPYACSRPTALAGQFSFNETGQVGSEPSSSKRKFNDLFSGFAVEDDEESKKLQEASAIRRKEHQAAEKEAEASAQKFSFGVAPSSKVKDAQSYQTLFGTDSGNTSGQSSSNAFGGGSAVGVGSSYNFADPVGNSMSKRSGTASKNEFSFGRGAETAGGGGGGYDSTPAPIATFGGFSAPASGGGGAQPKSFDALLAGFGDEE